jgi:transposase
MQVLRARCAGLDVHPDTVVACVLLTATDGTVEKHERVFGTTLLQLLSLLDWLKSLAVTDAAMESTGAYWKPVWNILEGQMALLLANAHHLKSVPGRKTDINDAQWIADLHRHGLLRGSFVPGKPQRELRELVRHRQGYVERTAQVKNELQEALESANIKLQRVVRDIAGVSAWEMLEGLIQGEATPEQLAELARGRMRSKIPELVEAMRGKLQAHHRLIVSQLLADLSWCEEQIEQVNQEIAKRLEGEAQVLERLDEIPGINRRVAEVIVAEVGTDMKQFPTVGHLIAWSGLCPGNNQSGGRRRSARTRPGDKTLKRVMVQAAHAASRKKGSFFKARYHRLAGRKGRKRALVAVGRSLLCSVYHLLARGTRYTDLGQDYYERRNPEQLARKLARRIEKLGFKVEVQGLAA